MNIQKDIKIASNIGEAASMGYATFNPGTHVCIDVPDGDTTFSFRTSTGKLVTVDFVPYEEGGVPQCIDIKEHHRDPDRFVKGDMSANDHYTQDVVVFGKGPTCYRNVSYDVRENDERPKPTLITLLIDQDHRREDRLAKIAADIDDRSKRRRQSSAFAASFAVDEVTDETISIRDRVADGRRSITNDAEDVIAKDLAPYLEGRRVFYIDTIGERCELCHDGTKFEGFKV